MLILLLFMVSLRLPIFNMLSIPKHHIEVSIKQKHSLPLHLFFLKPDGRGIRIFHRVRQESRLNNSDTICYFFPIENMWLVGQLIQGNSRPPEKRSPSQVVHELREELHFVRQSKRVLVSLYIAGKNGCPFDKHLIQPTPHLLSMLGLHFVQE